MTTHTPRMRSGRAVRTYGVARALAASGDGLDLLYARFEGAEPDAAFGAIPGVRMHSVAGSRGLARALAYARARSRGVPADIARGVWPELAGAAAKLAAQEGRGRVVADGPVAAAALMALAGRRRVIYNAHNFESGFRHELDEAGARSHAALQRFERDLLGLADESWMVSHADVAAARELSPRAHVRYAPNVVDVGAIVPVVPLAGAERVLFVASYSYPPNRDGVRFLLEEVMPRVWERRPAATLALAGAGLELAPTDARVHALGFVAELRDAYAASSCAVAPLRLGGGTPLKLIEALAYGLPVVATPRAVAGLELEDGRDCLVAEDADAFADALVRLFAGEGAEIGRRGRAVAAERYSIEALTRLLAA